MDTAPERLRRILTTDPTRDPELTAQLAGYVLAAYEAIAAQLAEAETQWTWRTTGPAGTGTLIGFVMPEQTVRRHVSDMNAARALVSDRKPLGESQVLRRAVGPWIADA